MMIDYASSHVLTTIRDVAGEEAVAALLQARAGIPVYLPALDNVTPDCELARIVGLEAALAIVARLEGPRSLMVPTGRGFGHGRRLDWRAVVELARQGVSQPAIARRVQCTERQVRNILSRHAGDPNQLKLF